MRAYVDKETCTGCGLCVETCPEVFEMQGDIAGVRVDEVAEDSKDCARQATEECPVEAITIEE